jgi:hypothetical protein
MPAYEFENEEHAVVLVAQFPVNARPDEIVLRRRTVPSRVTIGTGAKPPTMSDKLARGYKDLESRGQLVAKGTHAMTTAQIKRAIAMPDA